MTDRLFIILAVGAVLFVIAVLVGIWLSTAPSCTCGDEDCGGGCLGSDDDLTGSR